MNIVFPPVDESYIKAKIDDGYYTNATELVRDAVRRLREMDDNRYAEENQNGQIVRHMAARKHETPKQLLDRITDVDLRGVDRIRTSVEEMIGAFSSPDDSAIIDDAMRSVREYRKTDRLREFGL